MLYSVKEIAAIANVTVKTLHHYHKIGILVPCEINNAGYRLYGQQELERLQEILFYRELDFPLKDIGEVLANESNRVNVLTKQRQLLITRKYRIESLIRTIDDSINHSIRQEMMPKEEMFRGFTEEKWKEALAEQSNYLKKQYRYNLLEEKPIQAESMNEITQEAFRFQQALAQALCNKWSYKDEGVQSLLTDHLSFLNEHGRSIDPLSFLKQAHFHLQDDFHRNLLESAQVGLAYFYLAAVEAFVKK